ncbi:hypothetical protein BDF14DRAFT_1518407 [Spinellus fusiger]|nr:hypothetical protein BDF14DRAFT_1518407 [Spinellus fusiger]
MTMAKEAHYDYELERLGELESEVYDTPLQNKGKRGAAVAARQQLEKTAYKKKTVSAHTLALDKIQKNRMHRKQGLDRLDAPRTLEDSSEAYEASLQLTRALSAQETHEGREPQTQENHRGLDSGHRAQVCFICNQTLRGDSEAVNLHIDQCLATMHPQEELEDTENEPMMEETEVRGETSEAEVSPLSSGWEEYEWAGQTRVRATAMMEGGYRGAGFATTSKEEDVEEDLDVEDDDAAQFGQSQYTERDIVVNDEDDNEDAFALREMVSGTPARESTATSSVQEEEEEEEEEEKENVSMREGFEATATATATSAENGSEWSHSSPLNSSVSAAPGQSRLVIDSLRSRIQQLEAASISTPRCLICLEPYKTPLASIVCWHVHCEQCWLQTLGSKKLCPQCQKITTPSDLRRVYF